MRSFTQSLGHLSLSLFLSGSLVSSAFAAPILGHTIFKDPVHGDRPIVYEIKDGYAIVEGDIILGTVEEIERQGAVYVSSKSKIWPGGVLPYKVSSKFSTKMKSRINQAMDIIEENTNVRFVEVTSSNSSTYRNYVQFGPGSGCSARVGRTGNGSQPITLDTSCGLYNVVHEIYHALGVWHEQSREDRNSYVRINLSNVQSGYSGNFNQHISDGNDYGDYDYDSVMHYSRTAFSKNGRDTITPLQSGAKIGQRNHLSDGDIAIMAYLYPEDGNNNNVVAKK